MDTLLLRLVAWSLAVAVAEWLLPSGSLRKYAQYALGLVLLAVLVAPILELLA